MQIKEIDDFFDTSKAACKGQDITVFFPTIAPNNRQKEVLDKARHICEQCEVIDGCLEYSLHYEPLGFWGGRTEVEREVLRRRKQISLPMDRKASPSVRRSAKTGRINKIAKRLDSANG